MSRQVSIQVFCDGPAHETGPPPEAQAFVLGMTSTWYELDLCAPCAAEVLGPVQKLIRDHGIRQDAGPPALEPRPTAPPAPRPPSPTSSSSSAASSLRSVPRRNPSRAVNPSPTFDGRKGKQPAAGRPWPCMWCDLDYASTTGLTRHATKVHQVHAESLTDIYGRRCPICGEETSRTARHQSLTMHAQKAHESLDNVAQLFKHAIDTGNDPHQIAAQAFERAVR